LKTIRHLSALPQEKFRSEVKTNFDVALRSTQKRSQYSLRNEDFLEAGSLREQIYIACQELRILLSNFNTSRPKSA
jgi:hypothetical protein